MRTTWLPILAALAVSEGKVYERCELARELRSVHGVPEAELATWLCIAYHESRYNTSALGPTGDHGLFQISQLYWCSPPGEACGVPCTSLRDDSIADDWRCAKRVHREHSRLAGNGFKAWAVYDPHCSRNVLSYLEGCPLKPAKETPTKKPTKICKVHPNKDVQKKYHRYFK